MEDIFAFSSEISLVTGKSKARASPGGALRKTLADVTNIRPRPKLLVAEQKSELVPSFTKDMDRLIKENEAMKKEILALKSELVPSFAKDMDHLNKENEALKKEISALKMHLAERTKITELSATELQKLRLNLQSLYQQNLQLAQANSQMLAELNSGKDRLKALNHEVGCLKGVLNVKTVVLQDEKKVVDCQQTSNKVPTIKSDAAGESSHVENTNIKCSSTNTRRLSKGQSAAKDTTEEKSENKRLCLRRKSSRFASEEPACTDDGLLKLDDVKPAVNAGTDKEKSENKRRCLRRQSSRFKSEQPASSEDLFELDDIKLPMHSQVDETKSGDASAPLALSDNGQDAAARNSTGSISAEERRMSIGRPSRRAAGKVQSYKEIPLNAKMRRST